MVTFDPVGRLGNFLFEAASAISYGLDHGLEVHIPSETRDPKWHPVYLPHLRNPNFRPDLSAVVVEEKTFRWHEREFKEEWREKNIFLRGYWQNEKYFDCYRQKVLDSFRYPWARVAGLVSVHVRRGDYLYVKRGSMLKHPPVSPEWYREQMDKFPNSDFLFFSDDLVWCKNEFGKDRGCHFLSSFKVSGSEDLTSEEKDLVNMSSCEHHICSASTFSWWAAWLDRGENQRIIFPTQWITPGWSKDDFSDVVPKRWEKA